MEIDGLIGGGALGIFQMLVARRLGQGDRAEAEIGAGHAGVVVEPVDRLTRISLDPEEVEHALAQQHQVAHQCGLGQVIAAGIDIAGVGSAQLSPFWVLTKSRKWPVASA